jgi:hypothetical protein
MALSKQEVTEIVSSVGVKTIEKDTTPAGISSTRSRLWQAAKRKGNKVSCTIEADKIVVTVTSA